MLNRMGRTLALAVVAGGLTNAASAQSLSTLFATNNNGGVGGIVYFDVTVAASPITITSLATNLGVQVAGTYGISVYTKTGTYVGSEANAAAWTLASTGTVAGTGVTNTGSPATMAPIVLGAGTTYGVAIVLAATGQTSASHYYTNGTGANQLYSNADLSISLGAANNTPFAAAPFTPRVWNGTINYSLGGTLGGCCLPAPSYACVQTTQSNCQSQGGTYAGNNVTCANANCPPAPTGACCTETGGCSVITQLACINSTGIYAGDNVTCAAANCQPTVWTENGDAGDLTSTAQIAAGTGGALTKITGTLGLDDADMYQINVCNAATFSASTVGLTTVDTQLFMFKTDGTGLSFNDDAGPLQSALTNAQVAGAGNGLYYLALSQYDKDALGVTTAGEIWLDTPFTGTRAPDGAAAAEAVGSWNVTTGAGGTYSIALTGSCFVGGAFGACCFGAPNYTCSILSQTSCTQQGGTYAGNGIACAQANCPQPPTGACCRDTGCSVVTQSACTNAGGTYAGNSVTCAAANCPPATFWQEVGDAGNLPGTAQAAAGSGNLLGIRGSLGTGDSDMFKIKVCDAANFSATTVGLTTVDTQLFVFKLDGTGVAVNDDTPAGGVLQSLISNTFVSPLGNGDLYLAVSQYDTDPLGATSAGEIWLDQPFATERAPDGPAAAEAVGSWSASVVTGGTYAVALTGSCFTSGSCYANCDGSTATPRLTANDFQCFINEYAANHSYANCDGSTGNPSLTANDFQCFINAYAAGCS